MVMVSLTARSTDIDHLAACGSSVSATGEASHWRDCYSADALSPSLLKRLLRGKWGAAE